MKPYIITLSGNHALISRSSRAVFVRKHNLDINLEAVKGETENIPKTKTHDWLMLIEGYKISSYQENIYLDNYAEHYGVKAENPIIDPLSDKVANAASIEKITAALSFLTMDYLDLMETHGIEQTDEIETMFNQCLNAVAKAFGTSSKQLN